MRLSKKGELLVSAAMSLVLTTYPRVRTLAEQAIPGQDQPELEAQLRTLEERTPAVRKMLDALAILDELEKAEWADAEFLAKTKGAFCLLGEAVLLCAS